MMVLRGVAAVLAGTVLFALPSELLAGGEWLDGQRPVAGADYAPEQPPDNWPNNWPYQPPIKREWPDGPNKEYLKNLQRPDNWKNPHRALGDGRSLSCCDVGDTVKTKFKVEPAGNSELGNHPEDRWYAWINGEWVLVPPDKIVPDYAPDGTPYLFMMVGTIQCFVRPRGGL